MVEMLLTPVYLVVWHQVVYLALAHSYPIWDRLGAKRSICITFLYFVAFSRPRHTISENREAFLIL